jgi:magnesium transporter
MRIQFLKRRSKSVGFPPGSLVYLGEKKTDESVLTIINYDAFHIEEKATKMYQECDAYIHKPSVTWIHVDGLCQTDVIKIIGERFGIHAMVLEDVLNTEHRPKIEEFDDYIYITLKMLSFDETENALSSEQVSLVLGKRFVLSFRESAGKFFDPVRNRLQRANSRIRCSGADFLLYSLLDTIVDYYFVVLERIGKALEVLEEDVMVNPTQAVMGKITKYRRDIMVLRNSIRPLREVASELLRTEMELISEKNVTYFRDLYDHVIQVIDTVENFRDMLNSAMDMYFSSVSHRMNEVMKVLTIIATIFIPLSFFAGIYGMNFEYMPELQIPWAYPLLWLFMITVVCGMLFFFRKRGWL